MINGDFTASLKELVDDYSKRIADAQKEVHRLIELRAAATMLLENETGKNTPKTLDVKRFAQMNVPQALELIFHGNGNQPLHVSALTDLLLKGGWKTAATQPKLTVTGALVRDTEKFEKVGKNTFKLKVKGDNPAHD